MDYALHRTIAECFWFLAAKLCNLEFRGSTQTSALNRSNPHDKENLTNNAPYIGNGAKWRQVIIHTHEAAYGLISIVPKLMTLNDLEQRNGR